MAPVAAGSIVDQVLGALREQAAPWGRPVEVTAVELAEALWLVGQGVPPLASAAQPAAGLIAPPPEEEPRPTPGQVSRVAHAGEGARRQRHLAGQVSWYPPDEVTADGSGEPVTGAIDRLPSARALPRARKLAQALRPLRYDTRPVPRPASRAIDEEATALRIAESGVRCPQWRETRRRRLDLDLVLDLGGSGPLWRQLAMETLAMLESTGAFRTARFWMLDTDSPDVALRAGTLDLAQPPCAGPQLAAKVICAAPRVPVIVILTDGSGHRWNDGAVHGPLRTWARYGTVLLLQVLPADMWQRTALRTVPVTFFPADDGYHRGDRIGIEYADLAATGLAGEDPGDVAAIPVAALTAGALDSWLRLLRGSMSGAVPGHAYLVPPPGAAAAGTEAGPAGWGDPPGKAGGADLPQPTPQQRVQRFLLNASGDAVKLARLLSVVENGVHLDVLRKLRHEFRNEMLQEASEPAIAEVLLSGLLYWTEAAGTLARPGSIRLHWHDRVYELLQARRGGVVELDKDTERVRAALTRPAEGGLGYPAIRVGGPGGVTIRLPAGAEPLIIVIPGPSPNATSWATSPATPQPLVAAWASTPGLVRPPAGIPAIRIGIWGSTYSGRTTFLTVLAALAGWQAAPDPRRRHQWGTDEWRVRPADEATDAIVRKLADSLGSRGEFPSGNLPGMARDWSLVLQRRRLGRKFDPEVVATVHLQDRAGAEVDATHGALPAALRYLGASDALLYFFDPVFDDPHEGNKGHSRDFFTAVEAHLAMVAAQGDALLGRFVPQHIAVCLPKLDDQRFYNDARRFGCLDSDPDGLPWVPPGKASLVFRNLCREQGSPEADDLLRTLTGRFDPARISYHALSSIGYLNADGPGFDPANVCNTRPREDAGEAAADEVQRSGHLVRGDVRPFHVIDPLISLVERIGRDR